MDLIKMKKKIRRADHILKQGISDHNGGSTNPRDKHEETNSREISCCQGLTLYKNSDGSRVKFNLKKDLNVLYF